MSVHNPDRPSTQWMADTGPAPVRLLLAGAEGEAVDGLHFAGEHTSPWTGWMQGALESARRVVHEIAG